MKSTDSEKIVSSTKGEQNRAYCSDINKYSIEVEAQDKVGRCHSRYHTLDVKSKSD